MAAAQAASTRHEPRGQPARAAHAGHRSPELWDVAAVFGVVVALVAAYLCAADVMPATTNAPIPPREMLTAKRREPKPLLHTATAMFPDAASTLYHHNHLRSIPKPSPLPNGSVPPQMHTRSWDFFELMMTGGDSRRERVAEIVIHDDTEFVQWLADRVGDGDYSRLRRPTLIRNGIGSKFGAVGKWSPAFLSEHMNTPVNVLSSQHRLHSYLDGKMADHARPAIERCIREKGLRLGRGTSKCSPDEMQQQGAACDPSGLRCALPPERHVHQMTMRQFWNETARYNHSNDSGGRNDTGLRFLYGTHKIEDDFESDLIRRDLRGLRTWFVPEDTSSKEVRYHLWFGDKIAKQSHFDQSHNLYTVLYGMKRVFLAPPSELSNLHQFPRVHGCKRHSMVHFDTNGSAQDGVTYDFKWLRSGPVSTMVVDVLPGDTLYIPPWWIHRVESHADGVAVSVWWPAIQEQRLIEDLRAVSMALSGFEPIAAMPTLGQQQSAVGAPLPIAAVVAGLQAHLDDACGTGAIRSLILERYAPFYGMEPLDNTPYNYSDLCAKASTVLDILSPATAEQLSKWRAQAKSILSREPDPFVRIQIAQDEAELLVGSALGVVEIQPFFMGCYGHLLDAWY